MIDTNTENIGEKLSELWANADGAATRPAGPRKWAAGILFFRQLNGEPPPCLTDESPYDRDITLMEIVSSRTEEDALREKAESEAFWAKTPEGEAIRQARDLEMKREQARVDPLRAKYKAAWDEFWNKAEFY